MFEKLGLLVQEFRELMDGICEKLDKKNSAHCKHIVDDYYIPAFEVRQSEYYYTITTTPPSR